MFPQFRSAENQTREGPERRGNWSEGCSARAGACGGRPSVRGSQRGSVSAWKPSAQFRDSRTLLLDSRTCELRTLPATTPQAPVASSVEVLVGNGLRGPNSSFVSLRPSPIVGCSGSQGPPHPSLLKGNFCRHLPLLCVLPWLSHALPVPQLLPGSLSLW